jgi:hypothetical protein
VAQLIYLLDHKENMKITVVAIICLVTTFAYAQTETELVKKCFTDYKGSILEGRGKAALQLVDTRTKQYYGRELDLALSGDSSTVSNLTIIDKLTVFMVRHRIPAKELMNMTGDDFFAYAVDQGMVGKNSVITTEIGDVVVQGNFARGEIVNNGKKSPLFFHFQKESNSWKIDLTSLFPAVNMAMSKMLRDEEMTDEEYIFQALEALTGKKVGLNIWKPLK